MNLILKVLSDFVGSNGIVAFLEGAMLCFFVFAVLAASRSSYKGKETRWHLVALAPNFNYVATIVAGLILTAASSGIGIAPAAVAPVNSPTSTEAPAMTQQTQAPNQQAQRDDMQQKAFKTICAWAYLLLGVLCILVFVLPVKDGVEVHSLVKTVALTTLGFAASIFGRLTVSPN